MFDPGSSQRLDPEQQVRRGPVPDWGHGGAGRLGGLFGQPVERREDRLDRLRTVQQDFDLVENGGERLPGLARTGRQGVGRLARQPEGISHAGPDIRFMRLVHPFFAGIGECDQVAGEIAAVDGGDVGGVEHAQVLRIVPVEEVPLKPFEFLHGAESGFQPLDGLSEAGPAEVASGDGGKQIEPDVGGRRGRERRQDQAERHAARHPPVKAVEAQARSRRLLRFRSTSQVSATRMPTTNT